MRTTVACQWCRSAKIKCHHDGSPPCRSCSVNPGRQCILSTPKHKSKRHQSSSRPKRHPLRRVSGATKDPEEPGTAAGRSLSHTESARDQPTRISTQWSFNGDIERQSENWTQPAQVLGPRDPLMGLDDKLLKDAFYVFVRHFPEFGFFHQPTFCILLEKGGIPTLLLCGILALSSRFMPELASLHGSPGKASEYFANYVRQNIMSHAMTAMDIHTVQTLLMLSLYDWGNGDGSRAWVYNGMATRIIHGVYAQVKESAKTDMSTFKNSQLEEACRTVWACFLLDAMIGCGKCQAANFSMSISNIPLPSGEDDFAFGNSQPRRPTTFMQAWDFETNDYHPQGSSSPEKMGYDQTFALIVQGFHIWQTISSWVSTGGRKRESPSSREPPWRSCSFWSRSMAALKDWRASQSPQLIYSASNINLQVYISRSEGERFVITNLLYYLNLILLHREYIPFVPQLINRPQGPIQPPLLIEEAPLGWWDQSAQELFAAASNIIQIMQELNKGGTQFQTPFTCFCVFSAASTLCYANTWPYMAPGLDPQTSSTMFSWASAWLSQACKFWKVANGWYRTNLTLCQLYTQIKMDPTQLLDVRRDVFTVLEENIQRLAGSETLDLADIPTANILLLLQRQQRETESSSEANTGERTKVFESNVEASQGVRDISTPLLVESGQEPPAAIPTLPSYLNSDQDLFANILLDPSGDWTRPFIDTTQISRP